MDRNEYDKSTLNTPSDSIYYSVDGSVFSGLNVFPIPSDPLSQIYDLRTYQNMSVFREGSYVNIYDGSTIMPNSWCAPMLATYNGVPYIMNCSWNNTPCMSSVSDMTGVQFEQCFTSLENPFSSSAPQCGSFQESTVSSTTCVDDTICQTSIETNFDVDRGLKKRIKRSEVIYVWNLSMSVIEELGIESKEKLKMLVDSKMYGEEFQNAMPSQIEKLVKWAESDVREDIDGSEMEKAVKIVNVINCCNSIVSKNPQINTIGLVDIQITEIHACSIIAGCMALLSDRSGYESYIHSEMDFSTTMVLCAISGISRFVKNDRFSFGKMTNMTRYLKKILSLHATDASIIYVSENVPSRSYMNRVVFWKVAETKDYNSLRHALTNEYL